MRGAGDPLWKEHRLRVLWRYRLQRDRRAGKEVAEKAGSRPRSEVAATARRRVKLNAHRTIAKDQFGNDLGGVRSVAVDVPIAPYFDTNVPLPAIAASAATLRSATSSRSALLV